MPHLPSIEHPISIVALLTEAESLRFNDPHKALGLCEEVIELAKLNAPDSCKELAQGLLLHGAILNRLSNYPAALNSASRAMEIAESLKEKELIAGVLVLKALMYCYQGQHADALQGILRADEILVELNSENSTPARLAEILNRIGWTYVVMNEAEKALPYLKRSVAIERNIGRTATLANTLDSLGKAYLNMGRTDESLSYALESVQCARESKTADILAGCLLSLASAHINRADFASSLECSQEALAIAQAHGFRSTEAQTLRKLSEVYQQQGENTKALEHLCQALAIARDIGLKGSISQCLKDLSRISKKNGDYAAALEYFEEFHAVRNEIFSEQAAWRIKNLEITYQVEQTRKANEINQQVNVALQKEIAERKEAQALAEKLATTDSLTELLNRRHFFHMAEREIKQAQRHNRPVALVMVDLDHFKNINDTYGHPTGDAVLKMVASVIQGSLRTGDIVCRYGGEEFAILMPETDAIKSDLVIKRIRKALSARKIETDEGAISVTFSAGIMSSSASQSSDAMNLEMLIKRADGALYEAKHAGRDRIVVSSD